MAFELTAYILFAFVTSITPGPNNYLLFSYGKLFGYPKSWKLMTGILSGFFVLLISSGYGIAEIITKHHTIEFILRVLSSAWLLYLAFVFTRININNSSKSDAKAGFYKGFLMQFVNPKAWIMAIGGAAAFMPHFENIHLNVLIFASIFCTVGIPCMILWVAFGDIISKIFRSEKSNKLIGYILFFLMIISIVMIWI